MSAVSSERKQGIPALPKPPTGVLIDRQDRVGLTIAVAVAAIAIVTALVTLVLAFQWRAQPFVGALYTHSLTIDGAQPAREGAWTGLDQGLQRLDHFTHVGSTILSETPGDTAAALSRFDAAVRALQPGDTLSLRFDRPMAPGAEADQGSAICGPVSDGVASCMLDIQLGSFPNEDFVASFLLPYASGIIVLGLGLLLLRYRYHQTTAQLISLNCFFQSMVLTSLFDLNTTHAITPLWLVSCAMLGMCLGLLAFYFPVKSVRLYEHPEIRYFPVVIGVAGALLLLWLYFNPPTTAAPLSNVYLAVLLLVLGLATLVYGLYHRRSRAHTLELRNQSNMMLLSIVLTMAPITLWFINIVTTALFGRAVINFNINSASPFFILPALSLVYLTFYYRSVNTDRLVSQSITYGILMVALIFGYSLLVLATSVVFRDLVGERQTLMIALIVFAVAIAFLPLRTRLQNQIDALYFRAQRNHQSIAEQFGQKLTRLVTFDQIIEEYRSEIEDALHPSQIYIFLRDSEREEYVAYGKSGPETDVRFPIDSPLVTLLREGDGFVYLEPGRPWPADLVVERARLLILKAMVLTAFKGANTVNGFAVMAPPRSGLNHYNFDEIRFLQNLSQQLSVAVERAQVVSSLEVRVRELDILSQVSQAINFTANFDDLLELLSTQADRLVNATNVYITLYDSFTNELFHAFFMEEENREPGKENRRWAVGRDLFSEVVRTGQPLRISDYQEAMADRAAELTYESPNMKAWLGVPLVAGSSRLGVLAAASSEPNKVYTDDHLRNLTDIGALAATSLERLRLFDETNSRARQLGALNDISSQLVAYESDIEQLLSLITNSAVEILGTEAGSLLLTVDDESNDLEFRVVTGGSGKELTGSRLPSNRGLVGHVATTGEIVIVNDAANDPRWGGELSKGKFQTMSVLAAPLRTQNRVIGVLEVLNKKEGGTFNRDDANLLTTFAGQAAVAIENARLFQMTDLQLSQRVLELELLERIDVELNRSLELGKVAEITVRYAMENTPATAGLLGIMGPGNEYVEIVSVNGYTTADQPEGADGWRWPTDRGIVARVLRTKRSDVTPDVTTDPSYVPSLRDSRSQITVPMLSGGAVNALLVLESTGDRFNLVHQAFVQRLADHATIAIANAQLYKELNVANDSKSTFVSFVAHELKNPITSIKGYGSLLVKGALGPLTDQQKTFMNTILSNAERMTTLVSDLNDITRLERGQFGVNASPISLRTAMVETLRPFQQMIEEKEQNLVVEVDENLPLIQADQNRLIQVLTNMVSNAYKYSPSGGTITVSGFVDSKLRDEKGQALPPMMHIVVRDTGIGMSPEDLASLFKPYFRSENPLAMEQPGTGLGMTITQGIITLHGGTVWVESELGKGTAFHFTIPLAEAVS